MLQSGTIGSGVGPGGTGLSPPPVVATIMMMMITNNAAAPPQIAF